MYTLKGMAIGAKFYKDATPPDFSQSFVGFIENFGRSFEFGLATIHYLKHFPLRLPGMALMGVGMIASNRMKIAPTQIKGMQQLKAILDKAKKLELAT